VITQRIVVIGGVLRCWRCKAPATVMLCREEPDEATRQINYCDTCWIAETRAYSPLVARDEQLASAAAEALINGEDDQQKAGVKQ
jgi:hypothetical protein